MDKLTDILSNFFVSSSKNNYQKKNKELLTEKQSENKEILTEKQSEKQSENKELLTEKQSEKQSENKELLTEKQSENKEKVVFTISSNDISELKNTNKKSLLSSLSSIPLVESKSISSESISSESISSESISSESISSEKISSKKNIKKYILRPSDFYKSNILIVNDEIKDSIDILSDLLYKLGLMKDVNNIYDNNIHVITSLENKKVFTKMLLDNPYLFFTNFDVKKQLSREKIKNLDNLERRTIYIIDNKTLTKPLKHKDLQSLVSKNVHVIIIAGEEYNLDKTFSVMGNNKLLIHKLNKSKNMQKHFYKTTIKKLCLSNDLGFDDYYDIINNEDIDIKYIILKNDQIRYN